MIDLSSEEISVNLEDIQSGASSGHELFSTQPCDMRTHPRITSWRVTKTSQRATAGKQVTLMQSSRMTTSRRWSGPGVKNGAIDGDRHAVLSLDLIDAIPTSGDLFGWVNNLDAFIKDSHVRFDKTEISSDRGETGYQNSYKSFSNTTHEGALYDEAKKEGDQQPAHDQSACRAKFFGVIHLSSFSQMEASR